MHIRLLTSTTDDCFLQVLEQNYTLWYEKEQWSKLKLAENLAYSLQTNQLPLTIVATRDGQLLGTCQLAMNDLDVRPNYYPWLINLSVLPAMQQQGVARQLIERAIAEGARLQLPALYLYTEHNGLFEKFGFTFVEQIAVEPESNEVVRIYRYTY